MNIAVVAANSRSGKAFVELALQQGHSVRAGVYHTNTLAPHKNLSVLTCDATSQDDLENLLDGQDAVVSFIGHVKNSPATVQTDAIKAIVRAMKKLGMRRIISLTGTGVRLPGDRITFLDRILNASISLIDPNRVNDGKLHAKVLQESNLDWTIIRVLKLQNTKPKTFSLKSHGPTKLYVSRQDVARAALQVIEEQSFVKQAPIIGKKEQ